MIDNRDIPCKTSRRGIRHEKNPFIGNALANTKAGKKRMVDETGNKGMVIANTDTGEIIAPAGFWQYEEVDRTKFVKLYVNGVKAFKDLTSAGTTVFEILYTRVQEEVGNDMIFLTFPRIDQNVTQIAQATFYRGMKELLSKGFIAESTVPGMYFLNPDYMWNGDRLAFVKAYHCKTEKKYLPKRQYPLLDFIDGVQDVIQDAPQIA